MALVSPKWDHHLGTLLNNLFPQWNDWWDGIRWQRCRLEWSRVESSRGLPISGSAPVAPWFISTAPQRPQGGDLSVSRRCVQEDELGLQTHHTKTLSLSIVLSLLHSNLPLPPLLCNSPSFPYSINLYSFHHISHLPLLFPIWKLHAGMTCGHISGRGRGEWWWWMPRLSVIRALTQMCAEIF